MALVYPRGLMAVRERRTPKPNTNPEAPQSTQPQSIQPQPTQPQAAQPSPQPRPSEPRGSVPSLPKIPLFPRQPTLPAPTVPKTARPLGRAPEQPLATPESLSPKGYPDPAVHGLNPDDAYTEDADITSTDTADIHTIDTEHTEAEADEVDTEYPAATPHRPGRYRAAFRVLFGALLLTALIAASWFALPIRTVQVTGNHHLSAAQIKQLAGLGGKQPFGWLYYGTSRAQPLADNPWVESVRLTRRFPDTLQITVHERTPVAWKQTKNGQLVALAADSTLLPGYRPAPVADPATELAQRTQTGGGNNNTSTSSSAQRTLPIISGWGPDRSDDALYAASALSRYNVKSVEYSPTGITIQTDKATIWSGDRELLLKYAAAIESQREGSRINLYPWGVSVQK